MRRRHRGPYRGGPARRAPAYPSSIRLSRRGSEARSSFQASNPGENILILWIDLDLYSIEGIDIWNKPDIAKTERASQIFAPLKFFFKAIKAFGNLGPRLLNDLRISFRFGFTELAIELRTSWIEVVISQVLHESCPRPPLRIFGH